MEERNWCEFYQDIESDPERMIPDLTVLDYLNARNHVAACEDCYAITERVLDKCKDDNVIKFNMN